MRTSIRDERIVIHSSIQQKIKGVINPLKGIPSIASPGDVYIINTNSKDFEVGDIIIRNDSNTEWIHLKVGVVTALSGIIDDMFNRVKNLCSIENRTNRLDIDRKIGVLEAKLQELERNFDERLKVIEKNI